MKNFLILFFLCSLSLLGKSQVVTGVYKGKMVSDSLKYSVDFELTLKEKNGELYGYCQRLFLIDDVLYYNLVKVKARIKDSVLIVEDEKSVSNNFEQKTKGIKTVYMFNIKDIVDTAAVLYGDWSTSSWRNLYAMPGKLVVNRERNYLATQLYKRLEEKKLTKEMMFDEPKPVLVSTPTKPQPTDVTVNKPADTKPTTNSLTQDKTEVKMSKDTLATNTVAVNKSGETKPKPTDIAVNQTTDKPTPTPIQNKPVVNTVKDSSNKTTVAVNNPQQSTTKPNDVAITQPNNKPPVTTANQPTQNTTNKPATTNGNNTAAASTNPQQNKPLVTKPADSTNKTSVAVNNPQQTKPQQTTVAVNQPNKPPVTTQTQPTVITNKPTTTNPVVTNQQQQKPQPTGPAVTTSKPNTNPVTTNPQQNTSTVSNKPVEQKPTTPVVVTPSTTNQPTQSNISTIGNVNAGSTATQPQAGKPPVINNPVIVKRQVEIIEALEVSEDSVLLSLYDNGEIDGDTVSVFLNNELIVSRIGIKASAYKKTIAVPKGEIIQLTLYAENLGSIPPNTGLLIVTTTNERYQVNFSSTLNKSSSIVLKRKE